MGVRRRKANQKLLGGDVHDKEYFDVGETEAKSSPSSQTIILQAIIAIFGLLFAGGLVLLVIHQTLGGKQSKVGVECNLVCTCCVPLSYNRTLLLTTRLNTKRSQNVAQFIVILLEAAVVLCAHTRT